MSRRIVTRGEVALFRARAVVGLVAHGWSLKTARDRVAAIGDGHIIQWIIDHEDQILAVVKFVMFLVSLFAAVENPAVEEEVRASLAGTVGAYESELVAA